MSGFLVTPPLLLAQARIEALHAELPPSESVAGSPAAWIITIALATISAAVVASLMLQFAQRRRNDCRHLFNELCRANQLSRGQSRALRKLSKQLKIANPSRLFLESELWALVLGGSAAAHENAQQNRRASSKAHHKLHRLREQLFVAGQK